MNELTLLQACRLLFGEEVIIGRDFLDYLQPGGLKSVFRKRARQTHPDSRDPSAYGSIEDFHRVQQAFQVLMHYLEQRERQAPVALEPISPAVEPEVADFYPSLRTIAPIILDSPHRPRSSPSSIDRLYQGPLPNRPLLFGHYLYYCGLTTWRTITSILVQQQRGRPRCGELGTRCGMLRPEDINRILGAKTSRRPFGEVAVALGILSEQQLLTLLRQQRRQQKKFGILLVEKDLITLRELTLLLTLFRRHNRSHQEP
ncbi:MAG: J domain-containing protein [Desulfobulbus sp.]|nr:J domain-containing protein [Desulfobulbus sp.]